ncbi:MAG: diacylglyceryl transferase, partial [Cyclobacteriaceae bacterium]|nr:diacylglyceryl transferase [Cyclobacteriaceae bacterium]
MSFPVNFELFGLSLNAHLFFETISYMIGFRYFLYLRKRSTDFISDSNRIWIILGAAIGALFFSRIIG